ncbi:PARP-domain-containing protein [Wolfiporia cocos MD-104 SS10]|uniref:Poly [ADP-ribose] polymerase n=1 Tax=Wolfiporia cocos (strain MD-104) TaxID=742152 RepID=A0A2H3IUC3_WOLCO|nr:PARP-domain-containing protein [Wolfiporia cocos MD-104 SS10]
MPPRKKAATADASDAPAPVPTRSSTRTRAPSARATAVAAAASIATKPAAKEKADSKANFASTKGKGKGKRVRDASDDEAEAAPDAKRGKAGDEADATNDINDEADSKKPQADAKSDDMAGKFVTVLKRGTAPVDPCSGRVDTHQVLETPEGVWDATLNQTNVLQNANKFYVIQLLHPIGNPGSSLLFTRWGRVGEIGQQQQKVTHKHGPFPIATAINEFRKQFKNKAGVDWNQRHGMVAKKGKYQWIERVFEDEKEDAEDSTKAGPSKKEEAEKIADSTLGPEIQASALRSIISQPTGDTATQLGGFRQAVLELTGRYYSIIPHAFGRSRPIVIDTAIHLKRELELVDALSDMEIASKLIASTAQTLQRDASGQLLNPLDANFLSLGLSFMEPIVRSSKEFAALQTYARDTHGATHGHYQVNVKHAYRVERQSETDAWMKSGHDKAVDGERLLLWHGSRTTNFAGILSQGLRIAPPEGYMFGKGVYFADSAGYCHSYLSNHTGLLLLCEVVAKPFFEQRDSNYNADEDCKKAQKKATKGLGRTQPAEWQDAGEALDNEALKGCHMPKGPAKDVDTPLGLYLQYNEIRVRYLLMVDMK